MSKTTNYNLNITPASEDTKLFKLYRTELSSDDTATNMEIIDSALTPTADPTQVPTGLSGKLIQWVSWITNRIKAITGGTNWYDAPSKTLAQLSNVDNTADANKNVLSATKLTTARTVSLTNDVTGSVSFDGSANASITATLKTVTTTANTSAVSPVDGDTVTVIDDFTTDGYGRVTAKNTKTITLPTILTKVLTGLSTATNSVITATDNILIALGKLQAQINMMSSGIYNPKAYGAVGDGITDDTSAFSAMITAIGSAHVKVNISTGTYKIINNIVFDANTDVQFLSGAQISIASANTVTFNGSIISGIYQIISGAGTCIINPDKNSFALPEWFGAVGNGVTDDITAINKAIASFANGNGVVNFQPSKKYLISTEIVVDKSFIKLQCSIAHARQLYPVILSSHATNTVLHISGIASGDFGGSTEGVEIENLTLSRSAMGASGSKTIVAENCLLTKFINCGASLSQYGFYCKGVNGVKFIKCHGTVGGNITGQEVAGIFIDGSAKGNTGIAVEDYLYYGSDSTDSTQYAYKDVTAGYQAGDRLLSNLQCSGEIDYGVYYVSNGGFSMNCKLESLSMDSAKVAGVFIQTDVAHDWQQFSLSKIWIRPSFQNSKGILVTNYPNITVSDISINPAYSGDSTAISCIELLGISNSNIENIVINGNTPAKLLYADNCTRTYISNVISPLLADIIGHECANVVFDKCSTAGSITITSSDNWTFKVNCSESNMSAVTGVYSIKLSPNIANSGKGQTVQFTATCNGIAPFTSGVTWAVAGGRGASTGVSSSGLLTIDANETQATLFVTAKSSANTDVYQIAIVNVY